MSNLREIKRRIRSVKNTRQITKAMQLVAASKMKRAQDQAVAGIPYIVYMSEILNELARKVEKIEHPLFVKREVRKRGVLLISTDRGLCGPLNSNLFRFLSQRQPRGDCRYFVVGRKGVQYISRTGRELAGDFEVAEKVTFRSIRLICDTMLKQFEAGEIDTIEVAYARYVNTLVQTPVEVKLVPFTDLGDLVAQFRELAKKDAHIPEPIPADSREMKFEPSVQAILDELPAIFVKEQVYQMMLSARASEHSARMVAMKSATDNATKLVDELTLDYNKARQAAITQEVLEIAAAAATSDQ